MKRGKPTCQALDLVQHALLSLVQRSTIHEDWQPHRREDLKVRGLCSFTVLIANGKCNPQRYSKLDQMASKQMSTMDLGRWN